MNWKALIRNIEHFGVDLFFAKRAFKVSRHLGKEQLLQLFPHDKELLVFDVGAHDGRSSLSYARWWPKAHFEIFEPLQQWFNVGKRAFEWERIIDRAGFHQVAVSNENGSAQFHISEFHGTEELAGSSSLLEPKLHEVTFPDIKFGRVEDVRTVRLDTHMEACSLNVPDFLHLDVQGAELMVLEGMGKYLQNVTAIWMEVERVELYQNQPLVEDVQRFLKDAGFRLEVDAVGEIFGDQLWVNQQKT